MFGFIGMRTYSARTYGRPTEMRMRSYLLDRHDCLRTEVWRRIVATYGPRFGRLRGIEG